MGTRPNIGRAGYASTKAMLGFPFLRMLLQWEPEHQRIFPRVSIVGRALANRPKSRAQVQRLRRLIGFPHLEIDFFDSPLAKEVESGPQEGASNAVATPLGSDREIQYLAGSGDFSRPVWATRPKLQGDSSASRKLASLQGSLKHRRSMPTSGAASAGTADRIR